MLFRSRAVEMLRNSSGIDNALLASAHCGLGRLFMHLGDLDAAKQAAMYAVAVFGGGRNTEQLHSSYPRALEFLAEVYEAQGREADADHSMKRAWFTTKRIHGPQSRETGVCILCYAHMVADRGPESADVAEKLYVKAMRVLKAANGKKHLDVGMALQGLAHLYSNLYRLDEAQRCFRRALKIFSRYGNATVSVRRDVLDALAEIYAEMGRTRAAAKCKKMAADLRKKGA